MQSPSFISLTRSHYSLSLAFSLSTSSTNGSAHMHVTYALSCFLPHKGNSFSFSGILVLFWLLRFPIFMIIYHSKADCRSYTYSVSDFHHMQVVGKFSHVSGIPYSNTWHTPEPLDLVFTPHLPAIASLSLGTQCPVHWRCTPGCVSYIYIIVSD